MTQTYTEEKSVAGRRRVLKAGAGLMAAPMLGAMAASSGNRGGIRNDPSAAAAQNVRAVGAKSATAPLGSLTISRRAVGPRDVLLDILYCGVCHSDIHTVRGEWGPTQYPCVPGHEIVGRVIAVGTEVTKFQVGDIGGVGCIVDSCGVCEPCQDDLEQYCEKGMTQTYGSPDAHTGGYTFGGYSDRVVVKDHFVIRIPPGADLAAMAPFALRRCHDLLADAALETRTWSARGCRGHGRTWPCGRATCCGPPCRGHRVYDHIIETRGCQASRRNGCGALHGCRGHEGTRWQVRSDHLDRT